jgi:hypothetical protein
VKVGDKARPTRAVTARDIELLTELTGDRNPLHHDEARSGARHATAGVRSRSLRNASDLTPIVALRNASDLTPIVAGLS